MRLLNCLNHSARNEMAADFSDDIFRCIYLNESYSILIQISMKFVSIGLIDKNPALVQITAWRQPGGKPFS